MRSILAALVVSWFVVSAPARAVTLRKVSETSPWPGVTVTKYRTSSPSANAWATTVDLCTPSVHVDATKTPSGTQATGAWAQSVSAQIATNGDFYKTGPTRIYGQAIGGGVPWPVVQTGWDPRYSGEWYYEKAGWIAFGFDRVDFSHTGYVKRHPGGRTLGGWKPGTRDGSFPPGTLALVSGFPELVTEGVRYTCASATASTCFPDREDMRSRNPRTAMGITQDRRKFILLTVDGRTTSSAGMYGTELAETMAKLGAWQAFNLDGGGSTQLWQKGVGYVNDYDGNNHGTGLRSVANHWGIFAGAGNGKPVRPGHCVASAACGTIPAAGGTIDNDSACFRRFGASADWHKETVGSGGSLWWTTATSAARPAQWAWWRLELAAAGDYRVEWYAEPTHSKFKAARYEVFADGQLKAITVDQTKGRGWTALGTFRFAAGGDQYVRIYDNNPGATVGSNVHVAVDAIRLVPATPSCGDGTCGSSETCSTCATDCGACPRCGDGTCSASENCSTCAADCGSCCGDGACDATESCSTCAADCGACARCGDGDCNGSETCSTCPVDCGTCCGDGVCDASETCASCASDCGACSRCGDGDCGSGEDCGSCPSDCGACERCGDGSCNGAEDCSSCPGDCGACERCGDGTCAATESCSTCLADCGACASCGDGTCSGGETCETCRVDCGACAGCGDGACGAGENCGTCPTDCGGCGFCGDGDCSGDESCADCRQDCGGCPGTCGDGVCGDDETCSSCRADCGSCADVPDAGDEPVNAAEPAGCGCGPSGELSIAGLALLLVLRRRARGGAR